MKTSLDCIPCFVRQAAEAIEQTMPSGTTTGNTARQEEMLRKILHDISLADWQGSPPLMAQRIHRIIRKELNWCDPYQAIKAQMNSAAEQLLPRLRNAINEQPDKQEALLRAAIGGNLLDAGAKVRIEVDELPEHINAIWTQPLQGDVEAFFKAAKGARKIIYLTDNAGEIFFDRVLIEALETQQAGRVTVYVRGAPVINDATRDDAIAAGITKLVPVFDNGSDAPGTLLEDCSAEFRAAFAQADMIIAKGQGNYESLSDSTRPIHFLFVVKCPVIAYQVVAPIGTLMVSQAKNSQVTETAG